MDLNFADRTEELVKTHTSEELLDLTVVIPALNEEKTVGRCIKKCFASFKQLGINAEVIVVDNGSSDDTILLSKKAGAKVFLCTDKGYGNALRYGFSKACGKYVLMADADDSYNFLAIPDFYSKMNASDSDMVIGTRLKGKIHKGAMPFLHRYLGTPVLTFILNCLYGTKISDSQCGMRMFKKEALDKIIFTSTGMEFASELLVKFSKHKMQISEIPIELFKDGRGHKGHLNTWRDGFRHLCYLLKEKRKPL